MVAPSLCTSMNTSPSVPSAYSPVRKYTFCPPTRASWVNPPRFFGSRLRSSLGGWLTGADAALFEIDGTALYLRAGTTLDFETLDQLDVTVTVDDATLGDGAEDSAGLSLGVTDVNEAPSVALANVVTSEVRL